MLRSLAIHKMAIHKKHKWIKYLYFILGGAQIGILAWGVTTVRATWVKETWAPSIGGCAVNGVGDHDLAAIYFVSE